MARFITLKTIAHPNGANIEVEENYQKCEVTITVTEANGGKASAITINNNEWKQLTS